MVFLGHQNFQTLLGTRIRYQLLIFPLRIHVFIHPLSSSFILKKIDCIFQSSFRLPAKLSRKYREFPHTPVTAHSSPTTNILLQSGTFVTAYDPPVAHHYCPKSIVYIRFTLGVGHSTVFEKCMMTWIQHYSITQSSFAVLKILCACLFIPQSFHFLKST